MANIAREKAKYELGSREQRGNFRMGAESMGPPLQWLNGVVLRQLKKKQLLDIPYLSWYICSTALAGSKIIFL